MFVKALFYYMINISICAKPVEAYIAIIITSWIMAMPKHIDLQLEQPGMILEN